MLGIKFICVGKMREKYFIEAFAEYEKRLGAYCSFELCEPAEIRLPDSPSPKAIESALDKEAESIIRLIPKDAYVIAMCVEGRHLSSEQFSRLISQRENSGKPKLCFIIGGSYGLSEKVKSKADLRLSMSEMTFPHHLARVMLAEQVYRGFKIIEGSAYHK